jgi:recombinational DNA repair protein (RecF pathway)
MALIATEELCYNQAMSYSVYSTRGFILGSAPSGEASKVYWIYTEDFGLLRARAQGVRLSASKLRYNLDDYSLGLFSLVKGREFWRLTGAEKEALPQVDASAKARVLHLVKRLVQGEEANQELFAALLSLAQGVTSETEALGNVLSALGYLDRAEFDGKGERDRVMLINKALRETQL